MNAFFYGHVTSKTTLKQFVEQFVEQIDNALRSKVEKESQEDANCLRQQISCLTIFKMERQIQWVYTNSKFRKFQ